jgi:hypothetical protein
MHLIGEDAKHFGASPARDRLPLLVAVTAWLRRIRWRSDVDRAVDGDAGDKKKHRLLQ